METAFERNKEVAATILQQLGGNRFAAMTGARDFTVCELGGNPAIYFKIGRNHRAINRVTVTYNKGKDLYTIHFERTRFVRKTLEVARTTVEKYEDVYADDLTRLFTEATGMYTNL